LPRGKADGVFSSPLNCLELYFHAPLCLHVMHTNNFTLYVKPWSNVTFYKLVVGQVVEAFLIIYEI